MRLSARVMVPYPSILKERLAPPAIVATYRESEIYRVARVARRVTGIAEKQIAVTSGTDNFVDPLGERLIVGVPNFKRLTQRSALRILEVLAYGFLDYAARESVCGWGLFTPPVARGRPLLGARPLSVRERVARHRRAKQAN